jgi:alkanesulfonate monooxygenase SsuD/methylene tetrahydromethanopterin reductase-like flavin-dependent oxidoreductase (luciferase family)
VQLGVGLPNSVPGTEPARLLEWARQAEDAPFTSLGVLDRVRYQSYEPLTLLAAAAAVTTRIRLVTMVVIGPLRSPAILAKEAATVDGLSGGRLVLGLAIGARSDDYDEAGMSHAGRGRRFSEQLAALRSYWDHDGIAPGGAGSAGPVLLVGGGSDISFLRVARWADGYVHGGGPPRAFARAAERARSAWADAGRPDRPKLWAQGYYALGDEDAIERGRAYMRDYYAFTGPFADKIVAGTLTTPQQVLAFVRGYAEAGCDELVLLPAVSDLEQLHLLADVVA